jgi:hypothetical protein
MSERDFGYRPEYPSSNMKILLLIILTYVSGVSAWAQSSARFTITRSVVTGGGVTFSTNGVFRVGHTAGQAAIGTPSSSRFSIQSGFWIVQAPLIFSPAKVGSDFVFSLETEPGKTYLLEYTDSLGTASWQNLTTFGGDGAVKTVTNSAPNVTVRFFRLREQ